MLSDAKIRTLRPRPTVYRVADRDGLCLEVRPSGFKAWRYRFRMNGKHQLLALGRYGDVSLKEARELANHARRLVAQGLHPLNERRRQLQEQQRARSDSFKHVASAWLTEKAESLHPDTLRKARLVVERDLIPALGPIPISSLTTADVLPVLKAIHSRAPSLARKARQYVADIVRLAIQTGLRHDGSELSLRGALPTHESGHIAAATDAELLREVLLAIDGYDSPVTRAALQLTALTAMRPSVVAGARWDHIDLDQGTWSVPAELMKTRRAHVVPLPRQAVELLMSLKRKPRCPWVFPAQAKQKRPHLNRDALSAALRRMGFQGKHATHGFRASLRTLGRERLEIDIDVLEAQLAHVKKGDVQRAYDRATFDKKRIELMQLWADYLDALKSSNVGE
ncbi:tyrosine-type recombinase/integrase [Luteimonas sp. e5]